MTAEVIITTQNKITSIVNGVNNRFLNKKGKFGGGLPFDFPGGDALNEMGKFVDRQKQSANGSKNRMLKRTKNRTKRRSMF